MLAPLCIFNQKTHELFNFQKITQHTDIQRTTLTMCNVLRRLLSAKVTLKEFETGLPS